MSLGNTSVLNQVLSFYAKLFAKPRLVNLNKFLFHLSLRGLGILNHGSPQLSGEAHMLRVVMKGFPKNPIVVDVGANVGNYSSLVYSLRPDARIYALEPHPANYSRLSKRSDLVFHPYCLALGAEVARLALYDYADKDGSTHASVHRGVIEEVHKSLATAHEVEVSTLDVFARANGLHTIHLLKIDTEGSEIAVLNGASEFLAENKIEIVHFEFNQMNIFTRTLMKDFRDRLRNFVFFRLLPNGGLSLKGSSLEELFAYQNILALRDAYVESNPLLLRSLNFR
jgi:FkbM family methyltransferase